MNEDDKDKDLNSGLEKEGGLGQGATLLPGLRDSSINVCKRIKRNKFGARQ